MHTKQYLLRLASHHQKNQARYYKLSRSYVRRAKYEKNITKKSLMIQLACFNQQRAANAYYSAWQVMREVYFCS